MRILDALRALAPEVMDPADEAGFDSEAGLGRAAGFARVVAFTGAGGKTTALYRLAAEMAPVFGPVVLTTTTAMLAPRPGEVDCLVWSPDYPALEEEIQETAAGRKPLRIMAAAGLQDTGPAAKLRGIPGEWVDRLSKALSPPVGFILVEADGARGRPLKAPGPHEPVIPGSADLVIPVLGIDALDKPLAEAFVHRPELVAWLTGLSPGEMITAQALVSLFLHPDGLCKGTPPGTPVVPLINKIEDTAGLEAARELARMALSRQVRGFLLGRVGHPDPVVEYVAVGNW